MEVQLSKNTVNTYVLIRDSKGDKLLCPIDSIRNPSANRIDAIEDCVEEDVVGRYAGNLTVKRS